MNTSNSSTTSSTTKTQSIRLVVNNFAQDQDTESWGIEMFLDKDEYRLIKALRATEPQCRLCISTASIAFAEEHPAQTFPKLHLVDTTPQKRRGKGNPRLVGGRKAQQMKSVERRPS